MFLKELHKSFLWKNMMYLEDQIWWSGVEPVIPQPHTVPDKILNIDFMCALSILPGKQSANVWLFTKAPAMSESGKDCISNNIFKKKSIVLTVGKVW